MLDRTTTLNQLKGNFDLLIIGGGIVGAAIARDAVMRGLRVALVEQGDFAGGTSSKTSKLIHGGLRYLEQGRFRVVRESLRERRTFQDIAPGLVHPREMLLPVYKGGRRFLPAIRIGLWLYDLLSSGDVGRRSRILSPRQVAAQVPELQSKGLAGAGLYTDCQMDDARLCLAHVLQAASFGAVCANYSRVRSFLKVKNRLCGAVVEDVLTGRTFDVHAKIVVNATGPWGDVLRHLSDPSVPRRLAPTKGSHLVLERLSEQAVFLEAKRDGRMFFLLPWGPYSLVGTTEAAVGESLDALTATADEIGYLLEETNRLFPGRRIEEKDILATFSGARPLLKFRGSANAATREHLIEEDRRGLVSVLGGKFTTARRMAEQAVDSIIRRNRWRSEPCVTERVRLMEELNPFSLQQWEPVARGLAPSVIARWTATYGIETVHLFERLRLAPALAKPLCPHHPQLAVELVHAFRHEMACTVDDFMSRRTRIAWSPCRGLDMRDAFKELVPANTSFSYVQVAKQFESYLRSQGRGTAQVPNEDDPGTPPKAPSIVSEALRLMAHGV